MKTIYLLLFLLLYSSFLLAGDDRPVFNKVELKKSSHPSFRNKENNFSPTQIQSKDPAIGWDGTIKGEPQAIGSFAWICNYQFFDKQPKSEKGVVTMMR